MSHTKSPVVVVGMGLAVAMFLSGCQPMDDSVSEDAASKGTASESAMPEYSVSDSTASQDSVSETYSKSDSKLGPALMRLDRRVNLLQAATAQGLSIRDGRLVVQLSYTGSDEALLQYLQSKSMPVYDHYSRYSRIDTGVTSYAELDALQAVEAVLQIRAMEPAVRR